MTGPAARIPNGAKAVAILGLVLIAIFWIGTSQRGIAELAEAQSSEFKQNSNLALALEVQANQLLSGIDLFLLLIKDQYEDAGAPARLPLKRLVAPSFAANPSITFIGVTSARGDVVESLREFPPTNIADREFFKAHQLADTGRLLISGPVLGRVSGRWAITLTRRINAPDGTFGGLAAISIEPSYLTQPFEHTALGAQDVLSLVLTNGITLARRRGDALSFGEDVAASQLLAEQRRQAAGNFIGPGGVDGLLRVFSYRTMRDYPVIATVGTLERDAFAAVRQRRRTYFLVAGVLSVVFGGACAGGVVLLMRADRAAHTLREQASLLDKAQDAILVTDLQRRLTFWNKSAERLYGWTAGEAVGRVVTDLFYPGGDAREVQQAYDDVIARGEWAGELQPHTKDGRTVVIDSHWTLVRDAAGQPRSILSINTDVTDRRQLEEQFYRAQRLEGIGTLAGGIAHDLNNVLSPIMLGMGLLRDRLPDEDSREILQTIAGNAQRGADMVSQVLSFARGQEGRRVELHPGALIADVVRIVRDTLPKSIAIVTAVAPGVPSLVGDPTQFHQVLLNLCVNARDAMPDGGRLTVSADADASGQFVVIGVDDTGAGIPRPILDKIFDPFFTTKEAGKGTGLGLSTSQTIVRNHGGHIRVASEHGGGSQFQIYLPAAPRPAAAAAADRSEPIPRAGGETILVVDDEEAVLRVMRATLERAGYRVLPAVNGRDALEVYRHHLAAIGAVIMDLTMPVLGGVPAMQEMVRLNPGVRIIAASGIPDNERAAKSVGPQVREFLAKPFTADDLLRAVGQVLAA